MRPEDRVLEIARELGFDLAGIAPLIPPPDRRRFERWLDAGLHADMGWLERNRERIADPRRVLAGGRSLVVVGVAHSRAAVELPGGGRIARYAAGRDYHGVLGRALRKLARRLAREGLAGGSSRSIVDAGPLLERSHAARAGLGFLSKAANLLHPDFGPWFFLGELILQQELEPATASPPGSCGTCTACLEACPTGAILEPGVVDSGRCLSYQTIENRGSVPRGIRERIGDRVFGCDVCSEVCPWGSGAPDRSERFGLHPALEGTGLSGFLEARGDEDFAAWLRGSPVRRPRRAGLARNAALALASVRSEEGRGALLGALERDPAGIVREAAAWALVRGYWRDRGVLAAVERAAGNEPEEGVRADVRLSLEEGRG